MSTDGKDGLMPCLFSRQDMKLDNMKFWRGEAKVIDKADFRKSLCDADARKRTKAIKAGKFPRCAQPPVDVREWLATM